jgi:hypothetical protein
MSKFNLTDMTATQSTPKKISLELIQTLRDDVTFEEIKYEIDFIERIKEGVEESKAGKGYSIEEATEYLQKWLQ